MSQKLESTLMEHVNFFSETVGPRPVGSAAFHRAAGYVRAAFATAGLQIEELQHDIVDWQHRETVLKVGEERLTAAANVYSPACDVKAPLLAVCSSAELEAADISGKIVLFYGDLSNDYIIPLNCPLYNTDRDQRINRLLIERKPAAVLTVHPKLGGLDARFMDHDQPTPSATVPAEVGLVLLDHIGNGQTAHLKIVAESLPATSRTIMGLKDGPSNAKITIMAHFDTMVDTPGATDNATGAAAMLELAASLAGRDLPVGLEFIAFGDHEYYGYSDGMYVEQRGAQMKDIILAINMDFIGARLGTNNITLISESPALRQKVEKVVTGYPGVVWVDPWPQSNHSTFAWRGVPSAAFCATGSTMLHHQPIDTIEWVDSAKLAEVVQLVEEIIAAVQNQPPEWSRA
jgi:aminopeptidase YwaD